MLHNWILENCFVWKIAENSNLFEELKIETRVQVAVDSGGVGKGVGDDVRDLEDSNSTETDIWRAFAAALWHFLSSFSNFLIFNQFKLFQSIFVLFESNFVPFEFKFVLNWFNQDLISPYLNLISFLNHFCSFSMKFIVWNLFESFLISISYCPNQNSTCLNLISTIKIRHVWYNFCLLNLYLSYLNLILLIKPEWSQKTPKTSHHKEFLTTKNFRNSPPKNPNWNIIKIEITPCRYFNQKKPQKAEKKCINLEHTRLFKLLFPSTWEKSHLIIKTLCGKLFGKYVLYDKHKLCKEIFSVSVQVKEKILLLERRLHVGLVYGIRFEGKS